MTREEALEIIKNEGLQGYRFFDDRPYVADVVVIDRTETNWQVYVTTERCAMMDATLFEYDSESDALEDFIGRLRADKELRELESE